MHEWTVLRMKRPEHALHACTMHGSSMGCSVHFLVLGSTQIAPYDAVTSQTLTQHPRPLSLEEEVVAQLECIKVALG